MTKATIVGCGAVIVGMLLATVTSVYADHAATGKGTYAVPHPVVLAEFHFVVAKERDGEDPKPRLNFVQSEITGRGGSKPFQTFMISTEIATFGITGSGIRTVMITGEMVSTTFHGVGDGRQQFAELVSFTATAVDARTPDPGADSFSLEVTYSAKQAQGRLFASLDMGECGEATCTITFEGQVKKGDIFGHTSGDE